MYARQPLRQACMHKPTTRFAAYIQYFFKLFITFEVKKNKKIWQ